MNNSSSQAGNIVIKVTQFQSSETNVVWLKNNISIYLVGGVEVVKSKSSSLEFSKAFYNRTGNASPHSEASTELSVNICEIVGYKRFNHRQASIRETSIQCHFSFFITHISGQFNDFLPFTDILNGKVDGIIVIKCTGL